MRHCAGESRIDRCRNHACTTDIVRNNRIHQTNIIATRGYRNSIAIMLLNGIHASQLTKIDAWTIGRPSVAEIEWILTDRFMDPLEGTHEFIALTGQSRHMGSQIPQYEWVVRFLGYVGPLRDASQISFSIAVLSVSPPRSIWGTKSLPSRLARWTKCNRRCMTVVPQQPYGPSGLPIALRNCWISKSCSCVASVIRRMPPLLVLSPSLAVVLTLLGECPYRQ